MKINKNKSLELIKNIKNNIELINESNYENKIDGDFILTNINSLTNVLKFFYCDIKYENAVDFKSKFEIEEHKAYYINLGVGYPREIMGGHWCYVYKKIGRKLVVIPLTSLNQKNNVSKYNLKIETKFNCIKTESILELSDIRTVDEMRLYLKKGILEVITPREYIKNELNKLFND